MRSFFFIYLLFISVCSHAEVYQLFEENGKKGIKNEQGQVVIPPSFEALGWSDGSFSVIGETTGYRLNEHWGLINLKKEFITPADFEELVYKGGEYVIARKRLNPVSVKTGCINLRGEVKIPFSYDGIEVSGLRVIVFNLMGANFNFGLADLQNQVLIPLAYKNIVSLGTLRFAVENRAGKIALFGDDGKPVTDFKIDSLSEFYKGYSIIYEKGLQGIINREGEIKLPIQYQAVRINEEGKVVAQLPNEWLYLNDKNEVLDKTLADQLIPTSNKQYVVKAGGKFGLMDDQKKLLIPVRWDSLKEIKSDLFFAKSKNKWGVIRTNSEVVASITFDSVEYYKEGFRVFQKNSGWHLLDSLGKVQTKKSYTRIEQFNGTTWKCRSGIYWGLVTTKGEEIVHCVFDSIGDRTTNLVAVKFKGQYGIIDIKENWRLAPQPYPIRLANDTRYLLMQPGNSFLKSIDGKIIYFSPYAIQFKEDYWIETLPDGNENTINYEGLRENVDSQKPSVQREVKTKKRFEFSEGLRGIWRDGKYGFVDAQGKLRIPNRYDSIGDFQEGLAPIKLIGLWGFINAGDKIIVQPNYEKVSSFTYGLSRVMRNKKWGMIDKDGKFVLPLRYESISRLMSGKFLVRVNQLVGLANEKGFLEIEPRFQGLEELSNGFLRVSRANKWGLITSTGLDKIPMVYDQLVFDPSKNQYLGFRKSSWKEIPMN